MASNARKPASVIVIEDNRILALELTDELRAAGFQPLGPFPRYEEALLNIDRLDADYCVLDLNLNPNLTSNFGRGDEGRRLLAILSAKNIPTVVYSGYTKIQPQLEALHRKLRIVDKAEPMSRVVDALVELGADVRTRDDGSE